MSLFISLFQTIKGTGFIKCFILAVSLFKYLMKMFYDGWLYSVYHNISPVIIPVLLINNQWNWICSRCWRLLSAEFTSSQYKLTSSPLKIWTNMTIFFSVLPSCGVWSTSTNLTHWYSAYRLIMPFIYIFYMHYNTFTIYHI